MKYSVAYSRSRCVLFAVWICVPSRSSVSPLANSMCVPTCSVIVTEETRHMHFCVSY